MKQSNLFELKLSAMNAISRLRHRRSALVVMLMLCCASLIVRAHSGIRPESRLPKAPAAARPTSPSASQARPRELVTTTVKFSLYDVGIYPRQVHVDKGLIAITIEDYSGGSSGVLVDRETGAAPERAGRVDRAGPDWRSRGEIRLGPGRYRVSMADRPANQGLLVVEP